MNVRFPDEALAELVDRVAALVLERLAANIGHHPEHEFLSVREAADLLRAKPQRVYDLLSAQRLTRYRDGSRVLVSRAELLEHISAAAPLLPPTLRSRMGTGKAT
jgi:excisionase family DNA binding protein